MNQTVWIFNDAGSRFPGGVFSSLEAAEDWVSTNKLSGVLTEYPVDIGVLDWASSNGYFTPKSSAQLTPSFIAGFTCASQSHFHFEEGVRA